MRPVPEKRSKESQTEATAMTLLYVEDNPRIAAMVLRVLQREFGATGVAHADTHNAAVREFDHRGDVWCIVLDLCIPARDGYYPDPDMGRYLIEESLPDDGTFAVVIASYSRLNLKFREGLFCARSKDPEDILAAVRAAREWMDKHPSSPPADPDELSDG